MCIWGTQGIIHEGYNGFFVNICHHASFNVLEFSVRLSYMRREALVEARVNIH